jgi:cell fate regulator YaaT (PSP1 superfamily)
MACAGCSVSLKDGQPIGCRNNGNCSTGGCNRLNTYDWLATMEIEDVEPFYVVEVSFKNGARKGFYYNQPFTRAVTGDIVVVETQAGCDVGRISLSGELVRFQMRKKRVPQDGFFPKIIRKANERDLEKLEEVRTAERETMIRARAIARTLDLNMKIGDVEFQGDGKKATFYYTADGRVDFRELIRHFAKEFKIKIEMRQIGARQESARIGGLGPCGRELCCSTWLTSYRTVSTAAARYQNLAINQAKLSGQCGRLKCCLNYELDTYMEALSSFPEDAEKLKTKKGLAVLVKTDIFKGLMYYGYEHEHGRGRMYALDLNQVRIVRDKNLRGEFPSDLADLQYVATQQAEAEPDFGTGDVTGVIELPLDEKRKRKKKKKRGPEGIDEPKSRNEGKPEINVQQDKEAVAPSPEKRERSNAERNKDRDRKKGKNRENEPPSIPSSTVQSDAPSIQAEAKTGEKIEKDRPPKQGNKGGRRDKGRRNRGKNRDKNGGGKQE